MKSSSRIVVGSLIIATCTFTTASFAQEQPPISTALQNVENQIADGEAQPKPTSDVAALKKQYVEIYDRYTTNAVIADFMNQVWANALRTKVDRDVADIVNHPQLRELRVRAKLQLRQQTLGTRIHFLSGAALTEEGGQHSQLRSLAKMVSESVYFPKAVREGAAIFLATGQINAFTYSGLPLEFADFVVLTDLLDLFTHANGKLNSDALAAVMGHEFSHIKAEHVINQTMVAAIFYATGRIIIQTNTGPKGGSGASSDEPSGDDSEDVRILDAALADVAKMISYDHRFGASAFNKAKEEEVSQGVKALAKYLLKNMKLHPQKILELGQGLAKTLNMPAIHGRFKDKRALSIAVSDAFKTAMGRYSRACETTADRGGTTVINGIKGAREADALLAGGKGTDPDALEKQAERLAHETALNPQFADIPNAGDHPATVDRVVQYKQFATTSAYKNLSDPFREALFYYFNLSSKIDSINADIKDDSEELPTLNNARMARDSFTALGRDLSLKISSDLAAEFADPKNPHHPRFEGFVDFMEGYLQSTQGRVPLEVGKERRLFSDIEEALAKAPDSKARQFAEAFIEKLRPQEPGFGALKDQFKQMVKADCGELLDPAAGGGSKGGPGQVRRIVRKPPTTPPASSGPNNG